MEDECLADGAPVGVSSRGKEVEGEDEGETEEDGDGGEERGDEEHHRGGAEEPHQRGVPGKVLEHGPEVWS